MFKNLHRQNRLENISVNLKNENMTFANGGG